MPDIFNPKDAVHTPPEVYARATTALQRQQEFSKRGMPLGLPGMSEYFAPLVANDLCVVQAQTSNYKSGFIANWANFMARYAKNTNPNRVVIFVSVEEVLEEQAYRELARSAPSENAGDLARGIIKDWNNIRKAASELSALPIIRIAPSLDQPEMLSQLYTTNIFRAIRSVTQVIPNAEIGAIFIDYLQALPLDPEADKSEIRTQRRLQVRQDIYRMLQASIEFRCPVIVAAQSRQNLEGTPSRDVHLPGVYDCEESSAIAQRASRMISLWMPKQNYAIGQTFRFGQQSYVVTDDLLFVRVLKQRGNLPAGKIFPMRISYADNTIHPYESGVM